jgi:uncharacterized protein (TIGR00106 family)
MSENVIAEIAICPVGTESTEISSYVRECIEIVRSARDIKYEISSMGTNIEGPLPRVLELMRQMHEIPFTMGAKRVLTTLKIDDRRDRTASIADKLRAVE